MAVYIETLILYVVLFFSGAVGMTAGGELEGFSITAEFYKIFFYIVPALALIWFLLLKAKKVKDWKIQPGKKDLISFCLAFPCLMITGTVVAYVSSFIGGTSAQVTLHSPSTIAEWAVLCFSCISAAYLEECFFRFYILSRRDEYKISATLAIFLSVALFSICHIYEGPWGVLNSVISGAFLAFIFIRYNALHGIAIAHSLYNIAVYVYVGVS